jgi:hypothetical protein
MRGMNRRSCLLKLWALGGLGALWGVGGQAAESRGDIAAAAGVQRLVAAWHRGPASTDEAAAGSDHVGVLCVDWPAGAIRIESELDLPQRAHGLTLLEDGGFLVVANRPGQWLLRCDGHSRVVQRHAMEDEPAPRTLNGHALSSPDGHWLYTTETDARSGAGWLSVRDARTLRRVDQWPTHGMDPHQCLVDGHGALLVANGGIPRNAQGRKRELERMAPSLVRLDGRGGGLLGQWRLSDPRLSIRHLAWSLDDEDAPLLGVALQAEHDEPAQRREAPLLAVWDGQALKIPSNAAAGAGYAGDIAPAVGGGFVLSGQKAGRGLLWHPGAPATLTTVAELREICALATWSDGDLPGVLIAGARGIACWHPRLAPRMLPWPQDMAPDNHWLLLG